MEVAKGMVEDVNPSPLLDNANFAATTREGEATEVDWYLVGLLSAGMAS